MNGPCIRFRDLRRFLGSVASHDDMTDIIVYMGLGRTFSDFLELFVKDCWTQSYSLYE